MRTTYRAVAPPQSARADRGPRPGPRVRGDAPGRDFSPPASHARHAPLATARAATDAKQGGILKAQQSVKLLTGGSSWDELQAQKDVVSTQIAYDAAAANLKQLETSHNLGVDLIAAQTGYDTSVSALTSARAKLDQIRAGATNADLVAAQSGVEQGKSALAAAQAKLEQTMHGAQDADLVAAQTAVDTAQSSMEAAQARVDEAADAVEEELDDAVYSRNGESLEQIVGYWLQMRNATLAVAESCTGGCPWRARSPAWPWAGRTDRTAGGNRDW